MKKRYLLAGVSCVLFLLSCWCDEWGDKPTEPTDWFSCTDTRVALLAETVQAIELKHPFMAAFCETYGLPLWDCADIYQEPGDNAVHFWIPLYKDDYPNEIRVLWYFRLEDGLLDYGPVTRDADFLCRYGQDAEFDYLSYRVFGEDNASGLVFDEHPDTRNGYGSYEVIGMECRDAYIIVELDGLDTPIYKGTTCKEIVAWVDYMDDELSDLPEGEGGGGCGTGVPVGGDGSGKAEKAKQIFKNENMIDQNWETIEDMIEKLEENCMGEALYHGLVEALDGEKIHIEFIPGRSSGFSAYEGTISIGMDYVQSNGLLHEMFHALQYYTKGKDDFNKSTLNCEIEAHYAQYLYLKSLPEFKGSYWEDIYIQFDYLKKIAHLQWSLDKSVNIINDRDFNERFQDVLKAFRETEGYSDELIYKYDPSQSGINTFSILQKLVKNC